MSIILKAERILAPNTVSLSWEVIGLDTVNFNGLTLGNASRFRVYRSDAIEGDFEQISVEEVKNVELIRGGSDKDLINDRYIVKILFVGNSADRREYEKEDYELVKEGGKNYIRWLSNSPATGEKYYISYYKEKELGISSFVDTKAEDRMGLIWYYKVSLVDFTGQESQVSNIETVKMGPSIDWVKMLQLERIRRLYQSLLLAGEEVLYYKRKQAGTLCKCVSGFSGLQDTNINCPVCMDTRFVGGFEEVKQLKVDTNLYEVPRMKFSQIGRVLEYQFWAKVELSSPNIWTTNVPPFSTGDLLIRSNNERYLVNSSYMGHIAGFIHRVDAELNGPIPSNNILQWVGRS